ncbi:MAG TPA: hypothetical protein VN224_11065, partial [Xanthomonadales bacterium]|nr:hypothetical protein [Xanthomonadales bacterium]
GETVRMNIRITFSDEQGHAHYFLESDSARLQGSRNTFGAILMVSTLTPQQPTTDVPLLFFGSLAWASETDGLTIPPQPIRGGHSGLAVPITDAQMAAIENARNGGDPWFSLRLRVVAQNGKGEVRQYGGLGGAESHPYSVPVEVWHKALDACGFGRVRIIELPPPPEANNDEWRAAADALVDASDRLRRGDYPGSATSSRGALERIVSAIEKPLGIAKPKSRWGDRVEEVSAALKTRHQSRGVDAYNLNADVVKTLFGFQSGATHRLFATRENAEYALTLTTALYSYVARVPIPEGSDQLDPTTPE